MKENHLNTHSFISALRLLFNRKNCNPRQEESGLEKITRSLPALTTILSLIIIPFAFIFGPELLLTTFSFKVVICIITSLIGCFSLACSMQGWLYGSIPLWQRILLFAVAILMISTTLVTDMIGILILAVLIIPKLSERRKANLKVQG